MGDIGFAEMVMIAIVAIIVYGKDLPQAARKMAGLYGKLRRHLSDIKDEFHRQIPREELKVDLDAPVAPAPTEPPPTPYGLSAVPEGLHQITLTWDYTQSAASYRVKRAPQQDGPCVIVAEELFDPSYVDLDVDLSKMSYRYVVTAVNTVGESADSSEVTVTAPAPPPAPEAAPAPIPPPPPESPASPASA